MVGVRPGCAFVVRHRVEQSDLRERWFCVHFHFSCGIKRFTMEGVWVYERIVLLPLGSIISRLQVKMSSQHILFLIWGHCRKTCRTQGKSSYSALMHISLDCQAKCRRDYQKKLTSQLWPPSWCWQFFLGSFVLRVFFLLICLRFRVGRAMTRLCTFWGKFWLHTPPGRMRQVFVQLAAC